MNYLPMCFQISPSTINTSTITSMLIAGITRDQILNRKVVCDLTLGMNCYSICRNTCFQTNFLLPKTNNYNFALVVVEEGLKYSLSIFCLCRYIYRAIQI